MKNKFTLAALFVLFIPLTVFPLSLVVRTYDHPDFTRLVFESVAGFHYKVFQSTTSLEVQLKEKADLKEEIPTQSVLIDKIVHRLENNKSVVNIRLKTPFKVQRGFVLENPFRLVFDLVSTGKPVASTAKEEIKSDATTPETTKVDTPKAETGAPKPEVANPTPPPSQTTASETPLSQKKPGAIETICIDPGHGGSDLGAVGKGDTLEKDITLKVGLKLKQAIMSKLGIQVVMTRENDSEVSLNSRVSIANNRKAHMFVSIHVNSSFRKAARGSETFYVSLKATDQEAFLLSQKENQSTSDEGSQDVVQDDELKMILWDMAQTEYIKESSRLAEYIQEELNVLLLTRNRGVKQAPFRVLMRAAMPAVLVEIAFLSNSDEEQKLQDDAFLNNVADAIYTGISRYIHNDNTPDGSGG